MCKEDHVGKFFNLVAWEYECKTITYLVQRLSNHLGATSTLEFYLILYCMAASLIACYTAYNQKNVGPLFIHKPSAPPNSSCFVQATNLSSQYKGHSTPNPWRIVRTPSDFSNLRVLGIPVWNTYGVYHSYWFVAPHTT